MRMTNSTAEIMDMGITCLLENLGTVQTEKFISILIRERSDYTKWRQRYFGAMSDEEYMEASVAYDQAHPFIPKKEQKPI